MDLNAVYLIESFFIKNLLIIKPNFMLKKLCITFLLFGILSANTLNAQQPMMGEIRMFAGNYAPKGWAFCDGQILSISQNTSLYAILGTTYGGNGIVTFALPDLRGRVALNEGSGPGLSHYSLGQKAGSETNKLNPINLPAHVHQVPVLQTDLNSSQTFIKGNKSVVSTGSESNSNLVSASSGNAQPVNNMQPYLTVHYIIALVGVFPARD
jgi:microcystin-dependent protein